MPIVPFGGGEQFFTDARMAAIAVAVFVLMGIVGGVLFHWRDLEILWVGVFEGIHLMPLIHYVSLIQNPTATPLLFSEANLLSRPGLVSLWALILIYCFVRLSLKSRLRK